MGHSNEAFLRHELIDAPAILSIGSLALSSFMSTALLGSSDWRPIAICVLSDYIAIGLDHYLEHSTTAKNSEVECAAPVLRRCRNLLILAAVLLSLTLACCPLGTWMEVLKFFAPAFLWDCDLSLCTNKLTGFCSARKRSSGKTTYRRSSTWSIKRIPGAKALLVGIIRVYGTNAVIHSCMNAEDYTLSLQSPAWTETTFFLWSIIDRTCHAVMEDIRDYQDDLHKNIPTIPVLLRSVKKAKLLIFCAHTFTLAVCFDNPYIVFSTMYSIALVCTLGENSPRTLYHLSYHSQTLAFILFAFHRMCM